MNIEWIWYDERGNKIDLEEQQVIQIDDDTKQRLNELCRKIIETYESANNNGFFNDMPQGCTAVGATPGDE